MGGIHMKKQISAIIALLLVTVLTAAAVSALPVAIDEVEIDDTTVNPGDTTRLNLERGNEFTVDVKLSAFEDVSNVEVEAFITGYEYNDDSSSRLSDVTSVFDMEANVTYVKHLKLSLPTDADRDDYKIRVLVSDRYGDEILENYNIKLDAARHQITITDVILSPAGEVRSGSALLATVRLENYGQDSEDDVKVTASIPALGVSSSDYIDEIKDDKQKDTEELYMRIPRCAAAGRYDLVVDVAFNRGRDHDKRTLPIVVTQDDTCKAQQPAQPNQPTTMITLGTQLQNAAAGETVSFPLTLTNSGATARSYTVTISGADWADIQLSPASTVVVDAGKSQTINVFATVKEDTAVGPHTMTATVSAGTDKLQDLTLTTNVSEPKTSGWDTFKKVLIAVLIVLVVLLVILGVIIGISRMKGGDDDDAKSQTYY